MSDTDMPIGTPAELIDEGPCDNCIHGKKDIDEDPCRTCVVMHDDARVVFSNYERISGRVSV